MSSAGALEPSRTNRADVYVQDQRVAQLVRERDDVILRPLDPAIAIAFDLEPGQTVTAHGGTVPPFFAGLLPEGFRLTALRNVAKLSSDDQFGLLLAVGADCIGDVSVVPEGASPRPTGAAVSFDPSTGAWRDLIALRLGADPSTFDSTGIAGVQPKISATEMITMLEPAAILKLSPAGYPHLAENEAFFMDMAGHCGLRVAGVRLVGDRNGEKALLVTRFDRRRQRRSVTKVHVEDACQFLGRYPSAKYDLTYRAIAEGIVEHASAPPAAVLDLLKLIAFSALIGNGDLHAKNISLWRRPGSEIVELAPAYDLVSTLPYPGKGADPMALKLDGRDSDITRADIAAFGRRFDVGSRAIVSMLHRMCDLAPAFADRVGEIGHDERATSHLQRELLRRRDLLGSIR